MSRSRHHHIDADLFFPAMNDGAMLKNPFRIFPCKSEQEWLLRGKDQLINLKVKLKIDLYTLKKRFINFCKSK